MCVCVVCVVGAPGVGREEGRGVRRGKAGGGGGSWRPKLWQRQALDSSGRGRGREGREGGGKGRGLAEPRKTTTREKLVFLHFTN